MEFMRARTKQQIETRQMDIINACDQLFEKCGYDGITIKAISEMTALSRPSIYTYYKTKDEILLDILEKELLDWKEILEAWIEERPALTRAEYSKELTQILLGKDKMMHLYSFLFTLLEQNCGMEHLVKFKVQVIPVMETVMKSILVRFPEYKVNEAAMIAEEIVSYILGLYPMSHLTEKQKEAVKLSSTGYEPPRFEVLCCHGIQTLLGWN